MGEEEAAGGMSVRRGGGLIFFLGAGIPMNGSGCSNLFLLWIQAGYVQPGFILCHLLGHYSSLFVCFLN